MAYTQAQIDEYNAYLAFLSTSGGQKFPVPRDIDDYFTNRDSWSGGTAEPTYDPEYQKWLDEQKRQQAEYQKWLDEQKRRQAEYDKYTLSPEEAARRREESYAQSQYGAQERYGEAPMYSETFASWIGDQSKMSQALKGYVESKYPSLRAEYEASQPRLTGYPTREEARAEAARRESDWKAWLGRQMPETYQDYYMQRPYDRGERIATQSPSLRYVAW